MAELKQQHERAVGDALINWLNSSAGTDYAFVRAGEAPDLVYASAAGELAVEVTTAYYDEEHARSVWEVARGNADMSEWSSKNFSEGLASEIVRLVGEKAARQYGPNCLLLIDVQAPLTTADELSGLLLKRVFPQGLPFTGVYVAGRSPATSTQEGGCFVIPIKPLSPTPAGALLKPLDRRSLQAPRHARAPTVQGR